jgi:N-acetylglucosamine-6-phosphate deacetylase
VRLGVEAAFVAGALVRGDVSVADGRIEAVGLSGRGRGVALPGFVDLQVNGFGGVDVLRGEVEDVVDLGRRLLEHGVTAYQPTVITNPLGEMTRALTVLEQARGVDGGAQILGAHLEGPFLSPQRAGAHPVEDLRLPEARLLEELLECASVTMVTLAPELPGAQLLIDTLVGRGICVSLGHSEADAATAHAAFARGARGVTHLFNAMRPPTARDPGLAGAALARPGVVAQLIADGVHVAPEMILLAWRAAAGRVGLVSDSIAAAGRGAGDYSLGTVEATVVDGVARRADGTLAGSVGTLADGLRTLCALGIPLAEAAPALTSIPAQLLGRADVGSIAPGAPADVVVVDDSLTLTQVLRAGVPARTVAA